MRGLEAAGLGSVQLVGRDPAPVGFAVLRHDSSPFNRGLSVDLDVPLADLGGPMYSES